MVPCYNTNWEISKSGRFLLGEEILNRLARFVKDVHCGRLLGGFPTLVQWLLLVSQCSGLRV